MAVGMLEQIEALEEKIERLTAGAAIQRHAAKDLSVVALIPEFTDRPGDLRVHEFLEAVSSVRRMGSWIDDKKYTVKLKLGGTARRFYWSSAELHEEYITWVRFGEILETRFRFIETARYHYQRLLEVKQGKDEVLRFLKEYNSMQRKLCPVRKILQYKMRTNLNARRGSRLLLYMALTTGFQPASFDLKS
jgi:hypothetical protein